MKSGFSYARTNSLKCSGCKERIKKGDKAIFHLHHGKLEDVYCLSCKAGKLENEALYDDYCREEVGIGQD